MPHIPPEQLAKVRSMDLLTYLLATDPTALRKSAPNEWRTAEHSSLTISNGKWHWFAGEVGGWSALDYLIKVEELPFPEAVQKVTAAMQLPIPEVEIQKFHAEKDTAKPFALPKAAATTRRVEAYLTGRGIDRELVQICLQNGSIYESYEHHNVVFVGKASDGAARFASLRGTYPGSKFRMDVSGSDKRFGFLFVPPGCDAQSANAVAVFESPIDALSFATLNRRLSIYPEPWDALPCLSCSGTAHVPVLRYLREHPNTKQVLVCFDRDVGGERGLLRISQQIRDSPDLSRQVRELESGLPPPGRGKDWNEALIYLSGQTEQKTRSFHMETAQIR